MKVKMECEFECDDDRADALKSRLKTAIFQLNVEYKYDLKSWSVK